MSISMMQRLFFFAFGKMRLECDIFFGTSVSRILKEDITLEVAAYTRKKMPIELLVCMRVATYHYNAIFVTIAPCLYCS